MDIRLLLSLDTNKQCCVSGSDPPDPHVSGPDQDPLFRVMDPDPDLDPWKNSKKNLDSYYFVSVLLPENLRAHLQLSV